MYIKLIVSFSEDESNDLKDQLIGLEQTLESEKERLNGQLQQLKTEYQEKNDKLSAELTLTSKYQVTGDVLKTEIIALYLVNCLFMV
jgi:site-specific DNA-adenine methylase